MPFAVSPGVNVSEIDLTTVVPAVSSTEGAIGGVFRWGPMNQRTLITSEDELASVFGKPTNDNAETFFTAASFLSYGNKLYVARAKDSAARNAYGNSASVSNSAVVVVSNDDEYDTKSTAGTFAGESGVKFVARYPGAIGNSLTVSVCATSNAYQSSINVQSVGVSMVAANTDLSINSYSNTATVRFDPTSVGPTDASVTTAVNGVINQLSIGDVVTIGNSTIGTQKLKISSIGALTTNTTHAFFTITFTAKSSLKSDFVGTSISREWEFAGSTSLPPGQSVYQSQFGNTSAQDELHVVVVDRGGQVSGVPGTVLEVFQNVSRATNGKTVDGSINFYKDVIAQQSSWIWALNDMTGATSAAAASLTSASGTTPIKFEMTGGVDTGTETSIAFASIAEAYDQFASASRVDISLLLTGKSRGGTNGEQLGNYLIDNIAEKRKDCVVFISPDKADVVNNSGDIVADLVTFRNSVNSSSYAVLDSGYKYAYDKYNDLYRYVPLNGDVAGLCVKTDSLRDPWWSPAGFNRGQVKNVVKLAYNPAIEAQRDILYQNGINPVVTFPGQGTILYGDKTLLNKPSAFNRINVRRLFITLEKAISTAAKFTLFEFNDEFTRAQFRNLVEPFLRDVQGRRGITDFRVVCDTTNNTGEVIDRNEFIGDIYIKPVRSINFIQLNFVAVRTGVEFSEIVGKF